jgi:hypothetical protein
MTFPSFLSVWYILIPVSAALLLIPVVYLVIPMLVQYVTPPPSKIIQEFPGIPMVPPPPHKLTKLDLCKTEAIICLPYQQKNVSKIHLGPNASI